MQVTISGVAYFISGVIWFFPVLFLLLFGIESLGAICLANRKAGKPLRFSRRSAGIILFGVLMACALVIFFTFYPGSFSSDAMDQLNQAYGNSRLNDWHPVLHTLCMRAVVCLTNNSGLIVFVQIVFAVAFLTAVLMIGYGRGVSLAVCAVLGCAFLLLPNQVLSVTDIQKDFPFTLALAWGGYLLWRLLDDPCVARRKGFIAALAIDLFLVMGFRHNGLLPVAFVAVFLIVYTIREYKRVKMWMIGALVISMTAIGIFKGPVYQMLQVAPNDVSIYTTMMTAVASCLNKDLPLSEETIAIMDSAMPVEDWATYYDRYSGHDPYIWGRGADAEPYDMSQIDGKEAFSAYFDALARYPDVVIKDRLDGADIMWDVNQPSDGYTYKGNIGIHNFPYTSSYFQTDKLILEWDRYYNQSLLRQKYTEAINRSDNTFAFVMLWRVGAYLIFFGVLLIYWHKHRMMKMLIPAIPMLGNIAGLCLVLYHQSFRYVYFIQVMVLMLTFMTIVCKGETENG